MTKRIKVALLFCLTLCVAAFAFAFAACGGDGESGELKYTVTVVDTDNNPVTGVRVQLCAIDEEGNIGTCLIPVPVDENGVAVVGGSFMYNGNEFTNTIDESTTYEIHLLDYTSDVYNTEVRATSGTLSYTITVE